MEVEEKAPAQVPNPGSAAAITMGCLCPVIDNHYGRGFPYGGETCFYFSGDCPVHGHPTE